MTRLLPLLFLGFATLALAAPDPAPQTGGEPAWDVPPTDIDPAWRDPVPETFRPISLSISSACAKNVSIGILFASTSDSNARCALYSRFSMPALLCSILQALRRSTQKRTNWRESVRYSIRPSVPCTLM